MNQALISWNIDLARETVMKFLREKKYININPVYVNKFGHTLIRTDFIVHPESPEYLVEKNYYFLYKEEHFKTFWRQFPEYSKLPHIITGEGESINTEFLIYCIKNRCEILFCYKNYPNTIFILNRDTLKSLMNQINPDANYSGILTIVLLKQYCEYHNLIRTQEKENTFKNTDYTGSSRNINEVTYCFPFKLLKRYE